MTKMPTVVLAIAVGVLVLLAVVAGVLSATRSGPDLPAGSPEAAIRDYVRAVQDRDAETAAGFLAPDGSCTSEDVERALGGSPSRVVLRSTSTTGERAVVEIDLVHSQGPWGSSEYRQEERFDLRRADSGWVITGEPWPMHYCEKAGAR